ncbi:hypothetical protein GCM10025857_10450 [Alicyclobacillus contaminans]|uniref:hypothetical protein n=1 Tax=Alicyclobacillus contaminans TaxID=392016 RepID=UPI00047DC5A1|nr:hypothetical protein [Alicyclobacillus contaminans]GMA49688.1 hypothetical protein GCM10025857_10450 [Alicyclobacillus contaminans]
MKKIVEIAVIALLLVGCDKTAQPAPATKPPWVASYAVGTPTVYYFSTGEEVQTVGNFIVSFNPKSMSQGPSGWSSDITDINQIEIYAIPGIDVTQAVAVKFSRSVSE